MKRKKFPKKKKATSNIQFYLILVIIFLLSFAISYVLLKPHRNIPHCANSGSCKSDLYFKIENNVPGVFEGKKVYAPTINPQNEKPEKVLGIATPSAEKRIFVDLSTQTLIAYQGSTQILKTFVSTGKWQATPTGNFHIWEKLLSTRMTGGEGADAYDLPNVPYVMYFYNDFGLHGAYWHDNFGHPMSHGCVNLRQTDAKTLYDWADGPNGNTPGTEVSICDQITSDHQCIQNNPVQ
ncbi:MAG TPA: L,D-transpeptidase [Patescibacteria group bacterium]|nr:L,D-transpeptidase [Patescibacteria group bacterium]